MNEIEKLKNDLENHLKENLSNSTIDEKIAAFNKKRSLENALKQLNQDNLRTEAIKSFSEFTIDEKIVAFDKLYETFNTTLTTLEISGYLKDDTKQFTWEEVMEIFARDRKKFWNYWNSLHK